jgi:Flp pilus assembly protein TadB
MSPLAIASISATLAAAACASLVHGVRVQRTSIGQVRAILLPSQVSTSNSTSSQLQRWVQGRLGTERIALADDVAIITSRCLTAFALGVFTVVLTAAAMIAIGALPMSPGWLVLALVAGSMAAWVMWSDAQTRAARRQREFRAATNDFIQLVAVGLTTDQSVEQAIEFALSVGDSEMFSLLRGELAAAPARGVPLWEALEQLGITYDRRELSELGASIERQGMQGVSITDTVSTLAEAMRAKALDELERDADRANANLAGPTVGFVITTIVFLAYPLALRIGEAFGG